jgi:protein TonB
MEPKKSRKADLERKKIIFFQVGAFVALLLVFLAFEYVGANEKSIVRALLGEMPIESDVVVVAPPDEPKPKTAPPTGRLEIVEKGVVNNDLIFDIEDDPTAENPTYDIVPIEEPPVVVHNDIVDFPDISPEFPGGEEARLKFLLQNVHYPPSAREMRLEGRVVIGFVVERDGSISNVQVIRSASSTLDEEAVRVAKLMPKWQPGLQKGKAVRARFNMPITFSLKN